MSQLPATHCSTQKLNRNRESRLSGARRLWNSAAAAQLMFTFTITIYCHLTFLPRLDHVMTASTFIRGCKRCLAEP